MILFTFRENLFIFLKISYYTSTFKCYVSEIFESFYFMISIHQSDNYINIYTQPVTGTS